MAFAALIAVPSLAQDAAASLIVAPPVLGPAIESSRAPIEAAVINTLKKGGIEPTEVDRGELIRLKACGNKMGCLADAGDQVGAAHVLHLAIAVRGDKVQAQLSVIATENAKPVQVVKLTSAIGTAEIVTAISDGVTKIVRLLRTLPEYSDEGGAAAPTESEKAAKRQPQLLALPAPAQAPPSPPPFTAPPPSASAPPAARPPRAEASPAPGERDAVATPPPSRDLPAVAATPSGRDAPAFGDPFGEDRSSGSVESAAPPPRPTKRGTNYVAIGIWGAGGASIVGGGVAFVLSALDVQRRNSTPQLEVAKRQEIQDQAAGKQAVGAILLGAGAGVVGVGALFYWLGWGAPEEPLDVAVAPAPGGASARVSYRW